MIMWAIAACLAALATTTKGMMPAPATFAFATVLATTSTLGLGTFGTAPATKIDMFAEKSDKLEGRIIPEAGLTHENVSSKITCLSYCARDPECMSFFYIKATQTCILHTIVYVSMDDTVRSDGSSYYIVGNKNKCPIHKGFFHKRNLNACYYVVTDRANLTEAVSNCSEMDAEFGYPYSSALYDHFNDVLTGSFLYRKREFWTGIVRQEGLSTYAFYSDYSIPNFSRWSAAEPSGHKCVVTSLEDNWQWESTECNRRKAYICLIGI
ncbi:MAG: lectin-like protein [Candidatus Thiodiazotropha sp.]